MNKELEDLFRALTVRYADLLKAGSEDPRLLKEVREFLEYNGITKDSLEVDSLDDAQVIELDIDDFGKVMNG